MKNELTEHTLWRLEKRIENLEKDIENHRKSISDLFDLILELAKPFEKKV